jgi:hypothetical protein
MSLPFIEVGSAPANDDIKMVVICELEKQALL